MGIFDFLKTCNPSQKKEVPQEPKDERKAECPNCNGVLEKIPGAKTKCPHCGEFMYVRTRPKNEARVVVTRKEAENIDHEWAINDDRKELGEDKEKIYELSWAKGEKTVVNRFLNIAGRQCGITEKEIFNKRKQSVDLDNTLWHLCNYYLLENKKTANLDNIISLYRALENIRVSQNKSANYIVKSRMHFEMHRMKKNGCTIIIPIVEHDTACSECKKLDGKEFDIDEAIKNQLIPPKDCSCPRCSISII